MLQPQSQRLASLVPTLHLLLPLGDATVESWGTSYMFWNGFVSSAENWMPYATAPSPPDHSNSQLCARWSTSNILFIIHYSWWNHATPAKNDAFLSLRTLNFVLTWNKERVTKGRRSEKEQRSEKGGVTRNEPKGVRSQGCRQMERELAQKEQEKVRSEKGSMLNRPINSTTNTHRTPQHGRRSHEMGPKWMVEASKNTAEIRKY